MAVEGGTHPGRRPPGSVGRDACTGSTLVILVAALVVDLVSLAVAGIEAASSCNDPGHQPPSWRADT
jgi:hypothetical protein